MGFALCGLGIFMLYLTLLAFRIHYPAPEDWIYITECLTGFGLGGSSIAMFGRVGGGTTFSHAICQLLHATCPQPSKMRLLMYVCFAGLFSHLLVIKAFIPRLLMLVLISWER